MDKFKFSLLPKSLRGVVILYTGQAGSGKSTASLLDPNNTVFIDADHAKGKEMATRKPNMVYKQINSDQGETLVRAGELFLEAISEINKDKTTVVVIDNIYEVQEGVHAYVIANPVQSAKMYNLVASNISGRNYGHDTLAHERIVKGAIDELLAHDITVVITTHMKDKWMATGQLEIKGRKWIYETASFVGIMIRTAAAPDVLVFKNAFNYHIEVDPTNLNPEQIEQYRRGELESSEVYQRIPRRIPAFTPTKLYRYLARTPEEIVSTPYSSDEILDEDEMAPYLEILSKQQRANVDKILEAEDVERQRANEFEANIKEVQRVELDQYIINNPDVDVSELLGVLKVKFQMFASEINPLYVLQIRQKVT